WSGGGRAGGTWWPRPSRARSTAPSPAGRRPPSGSAHLGVDAIVQFRQLLGDGVDGARTRLEDRGGVEGDPAEAHALEGGDAGEHGAVVRVEGLARRVAWRRRYHALQADGGRIAPRLFRMAANAGEGHARAIGILHATGQPAVAEPSPAPIGRLGVAPDPNGEAGALRRLRLHAHGHGAVVRAVEAHLRVAPVGAQEPDRLVHALAPRRAVLP